MTTRDDVVAALSQALGATKAQSVVSDAVQALRVSSELDRDQAMQVLEWIATQPGIVGITARFAKSRLILNWGPSTPRNR